MTGGKAGASMQVLRSDLLQPVVFLQLAEKSVARLLCVAQEHSRVLVEEDRVVDCEVCRPGGERDENADVTSSSSVPIVDGAHQLL